MQYNKIEKRLSEYNDILKDNDHLYRGIAKRFSLPEAAFWILYVLRTDSNILTQRDICNMLYQPKQTINSSLKHLELEGYIRLSAACDRRSKQISLTEKGLLLAAETVDTVITAEQNALCDLTEAEQTCFLSLFQKYTDALKRQMQTLET